MLVLSREHQMVIPSTTFVQEYLLPQLQPFNGINNHSVVVMSIHHISEAVKMIEEVGATVHFLPPYSPDLNEAFSKVKSELKNLERTMHVNDIKILTLAAFSSITLKKDCRGWISHCGIYNN